MNFTIMRLLAVLCILMKQDIGKIKEILSPGANDVWVVKRQKGKDILIPYIKEVVKEVDMKKKAL